MNEKLYGQFAELGRMPRAFLILRYNIAGFEDQVVPCELNERVELPVGEVTSANGDKYNVLGWTIDGESNFTQFIPEQYCTVLSAITTNKVLVTLVYKLEGVQQSTHTLVRNVGSIIANNSMWRYIGHPSLVDHVRHYYVGNSEVQLPLTINSNVTITIDDQLAIQNSTCELMMDYLCFPTSSGSSVSLSSGAPAFYLSEVPSGGNFRFAKGPTIRSEFQGNPAQIVFDLIQSEYSFTDDVSYNFIASGFEGCVVNSSNDPFSDFLSDNGWSSYDDATILGFPSLRLLVNGFDYSEALMPDYFDTIAYGRCLDANLGSYSDGRNSKTCNKMSVGSSYGYTFGELDYYLSQSANANLHSWMEEHSHSNEQYKHFLWWGAGAAGSPYSTGTIETNSGPEVVSVVCNFHGVKSIRNVFTTTAPFGCSTEGSVTLRDQRFDQDRTYAGYDLTANNITVGGLSGGNVIVPRYTTAFRDSVRKHDNESPKVLFGGLSVLGFTDEFTGGPETIDQPSWAVYVGNKVFN